MSRDAHATACASPHATIGGVSVFKESPQTHLHVRTSVMIGVVVLLVVVLSMLFYYMRAPTTPAPAGVPEEPPPPAAAAPRPDPPRAESAPVESPAPRPSTPRPAKKASPAAPEASPAPAPSLATLVLESDVPGASVFIDRKFVGTTPLTLPDLRPGTTRVNLSADGFDGVAREIDLVPGSNAVTMRFKEVRLDKQIPVVHKHGMGSCEGTLSASIDGFRYDTSHAGDRFTVKLDDIEQFQVDYLQKTLRLRQRGGKTWNFTDKTANADALFVFHRDVDAARQKLAQGYAAVK